MAYRPTFLKTAEKGWLPLPRSASLSSRTDKALNKISGEFVT